MAASGRGWLCAGTFGQVLKVRNAANGAVFALKVIRNRRAFRRQAQTEVELLQRLKLPAETKADKDKAVTAGLGSASADRKPFDARALVVQLFDHFVFQSHLCLLFEPLGVNLLQLLQQNKCIGLSTSLIRYFCKQLLQVGERLSRKAGAAWGVCVRTGGVGSRAAARFRMALATPACASGHPPPRAVPCAARAPRPAPELRAPARRAPAPRARPCPRPRSS